MSHFQNSMTVHVNHADDIKVVQLDQDKHPNKVGIIIFSSDGTSTVKVIMDATAGRQFSHALKAETDWTHYKTNRVRIHAEIEQAERMQRAAV